MTLTLQNPVMTKEMRSRLRGARGVWVQAAYLFILSVIVGIMYLVWTLEAHSGGPRSWETGQLLFRVLSVAQAVLIALIAPALTCGAITLERERQTMDFLLMTPLSAASVTLGKLLSAFLFMGLLLMMSIPLASISFLLGGVSPAELAGVYASLIVEAILLCSLGLAWSATFARTTLSTPLTYGSMLAFLGATAAFYGMHAQFRSYGGTGPKEFVFGGMNPITLPFCAAHTVKLFGASMPIAFPGTALNLLLAIAALVVAVHRVAALRGNSCATAARIATGVAFLATAYLLAGNLSAGVATRRSLEEWAMWNAGVLISLTALLALMAPVFATGEPERGLTPMRALGRVCNPLRVFHGEASSALGYVVLLLLLTVPAIGGGIAAMKGSYPTPHGPSLSHGPTPPPPAATSPATPSTAAGATMTPAPPAWTIQRAKRWCWGVTRDLYAMMLCALLAYVALGWAASALTGNRWIGFGIAVAAVMALVLLPMIGFSDVGYRDGETTVDTFGNVLYASPYFGAVQMLFENWLDEDDMIKGFWLHGVVRFSTVVNTLHLLLFALFTTVAGLALSGRARRTAPPAS